MTYFQNLNRLILKKLETRASEFAVKGSDIMILLGPNKALNKVHEID